ncbi:MAG: hypothetical protein K6G12_09550 [Lachnospiraceae bacterium]|nr:hypothetical protein [Lachnospiraceae bacterium]
MKIRHNLITKKLICAALCFCLCLTGCSMSGKFHKSQSMMETDEDSVVVYLYMLGTNLETVEGKATWSLDQIRRGTESGSKLTVIMEAGGTSKWKTKELLDEKTGRYIIRDGSIKLIEDLGDTNMMEENTLEDFLSWSGEEYPAKDARSMLLFWDHGGGTGGGFGMDELHEEDSISVSDIQKALKGSGQFYDLIGFDACLMQTAEIADALSPYGTYMLASEEREPGYGWYYTGGFEKLAQGMYDPKEKLKDFGIEMVDQYTDFYEQQGHGNGVQTLSLVDLKKASEAYEAFVDILSELDTSITIDKQSYSDLSMCRSATHEFCDENIDQIDMIDFLDKYSAESGEDLSFVRKLTEDCIIHNSDGAPEGAYGIAVYFPYRHAELYDKVRKDILDTSGNGTQVLPLYNDFLSIIVGTSGSGDTGFTNKKDVDYSEAEWYSDEAANVYREDFGELQELEYDEGEGYYYQPLSEIQKEILTEVRLNLFFVAPENGHMYDMGEDNLAEWTQEGEYPVLEFADIWVCIGDYPVAMYSDPVTYHDDDFWLSAKVPVLLNDEELVNLKITWGPVTYEDLDKFDDKNENGICDAIENTAKVVGYEPIGAENGVFSKGSKRLEAGDKITFIYDEYDKEGNYIGYADLYDPIVIKEDQSELEVTYSSIDSNGVTYTCWLTLFDIYQRSYETDALTY